MGERWLTRLGGGPRAGRIAGGLLALAAFGQAAGQAVTLGFANTGTGLGPELLTFLYAFPLCALALLATVPLLFLRPIWAAVIAVGANVVVLAVFPAPTVAGALAAVFAAWWLGAAGELRSAAGRPVGPVAAQYLAVGLALPFLVLALVRHGNVACVLLAAAVPAAAGVGIALRAGRAAQTYSEAGEALADTLVAHTARGERARIARELHDVVAHHISMIAVLAETGRLATPGLPEAGARRFLEIGDTARAGLTEMRRLLGVLREDAAAAEPTAAADGGTGGPGRLPAAPATGAGTAMPAAGAGAPTAGSGTQTSRQPQPGLTQLAELIDTAREASGTGTRLIISGPVAPLDPGVELAAYRIVQEALTNSRRHAPGAAVDVELRYSPESLRVRVRDNGPGPTTAPDADGLTGDGYPVDTRGGSGSVTMPAGGQPRRDPPAGRQPGGGHGLLGMRERAFSVGGALYIGAAPGGGFLVEAVLPSERDPVRPVRADAATAMTTTAGAAGAATWAGGER
jgi:signal transduction histidine kinase